MPKKGEYVKFKHFARKIKSPFMICADFESILLPEDNRKQNLNESYTNKYQKHVACSYGYKLVCVDDKFIKPFKSYLGKDVVYNSTSSIIEEKSYCSDVIKKHFNKNLRWLKKIMKNSTKFWFCDNDYIDNDVKVRDNFYITWKHRGSASRNCNINVNYMAYFTN